MSRVHDSARRARRRRPLPTTRRLPAPVGVVLAAVAVVVTLAAPATGTAATSDVPDPLAPPARGDCWSYGYRAAVAADGTVRTQSPVACSGERTARTLAVDELDAYADGHLLALEAEPLQDAVAQTCRAAFAEAVGGSGRTRSLSLLRPVWVTPSDEAYAAGASWSRCDAVLVGGEEKLARLPGGVVGALEGVSVPPARFGRCSTGTPGGEGSQEVPCTRRHRWRAVAVLPVAPAGARGSEAPYPGRAAVASRARGRCEVLARRDQGSVRFTYSAQFPGAADWRAGQRTGTCWLPDS